MREQCVLDLGPGDVVAGGNDHVVPARLEPEVPGVVDAVVVARDMPAALNVVALSRVVEIAAAGWPTHGQQAGTTVLRSALLVEHDCFVPRQRLAGGARANVGIAGADNYLDHLVRANAVDEAYTRRRVPCIGGFPGQWLADRYATPQAGEVEWAG